MCLFFFSTGFQRQPTRTREFHPREMAGSQVSETQPLLLDADHVDATINYSTGMGYRTAHQNESSIELPNTATSHNNSFTDMKSEGRAGDSLGLILVAVGSGVCHILFCFIAVIFTYALHSFSSFRRG